MSEEIIAKRHCIFHIDCPKKDDPTHRQYFTCEYKKMCIYGLRCKKMKPGKGWSSEEADTHNRFFDHTKYPNKVPRQSNIPKVIKKEDTQNVTWKYQLIGLDVYGSLYNIDTTIDSLELFTDTVRNMKTKMVKHLINKHANGNAFLEFKINIICSLEDEFNS